MHHPFPQALFAFEPFFARVPISQSVLLEAVSRTLQSKFAGGGAKWDLSVGQMATLLHIFAR